MRDENLKPPQQRLAGTLNVFAGISNIGLLVSLTLVASCGPPRISMEAQDLYFRLSNSAPRVSSAIALNDNSATLICILDELERVSNYKAWASSFAHIQIAPNPADDVQVPDDNWAIYASGSREQLIIIPHGRGIPIEMPNSGCYRPNVEFTFTNGSWKISGARY